MYVRHVDAMYGCMHRMPSMFSWHMFAVVELAEKILPNFGPEQDNADPYELLLHEPSRVKDFSSTGEYIPTSVTCTHSATNDRRTA